MKVDEDVLILGSGPAAAGAAMALTVDPAIRIRVVDLGLRLEATHRESLARLADRPAQSWDPMDVRRISLQPAPQKGQTLPQKRAYGSDFPFRDIGQLDGLNFDPDVNRDVTSPAYGGFSNVWGAQVLPFADATFDSWPISSNDIRPHYESVLSQIPFAAVRDDLETTFPLLSCSTGFPEPGELTKRVLASYQLRRDRIRRLDVTLGHARLAFDAQRCTRCGMCMTGCPDSLIYSASQTMDALRTQGKISYQSGTVAERIDERDGCVRVTTRDLNGGGRQVITAGRVFVACGAMATTRLVGGSLDLFDRESALHESAQIVLPFVSRKSVGDPRHHQNFTLNQFNLLMRMGNERDLVLFHFYNYNPAFLESLPAALRARPSSKALGALLGRLSASLGYLPSWESPKMLFSLSSPPGGAGLPTMAMRREQWDWKKSRMLRRAVMKLCRISPSLDLWPVLPKLTMSGPGKSYHWGGTFPHKPGPAEAGFSTDALGRVHGWDKVHLIDASVFPDIPATTFTLSIMANAHRIATEALDLGGAAAEPGRSGPATVA